MAKNAITKPTAAAVTYPLNHRATFDDITIQNNTSDSITVTITAQNVQRVASPVYSAPSAGSVGYRCRAVGVLNQPATAMLLSGTGTGVINIVEAY
jgi:hypothetical protein